MLDPKANLHYISNSVCQNLKKLSLVILLFVVSCAHESEQLFDRKFSSLCEGFTEISKYARSININGKSKSYEEIRSQAMTNAARDMKYTESLPSSNNCEDIEALASANTKLTKNEVYSGVLLEYMLAMDPHSLYLGKEDADALNDDLKNVEKGTGIQFRYTHRAIKKTLPLDHLMVDYIYPNSAASGIIEVGDEVETINGEGVQGKTFAEINKIVEKNDKAMDIKVTRLAEPLLIPQNTFQRTPYYPVVMDSDHPGYVMIRIPKIVDGLTDSLRGFLEKQSANVEGLVLDLRGNGGGSVNEAIGVIRLFFSGQDEIFYTDGGLNDKKKGLGRTSYKLSGSAAYTKPLVVLVDSDTASSAEIISSVLKQRSRAVILGDKTFGKGSVQIYETISDKSGFGGLLISTFSLIYYPNKKTHQFYGLSPDYELLDQRFTEAVDQLHKNEIKMILHESDYPNPIKPESNSLVINTSSFSADLNLAEVYESGKASNICNGISYDTCLEKYAVQFLEHLN